MSELDIHEDHQNDPETSKICTIESYLDAVGNSCRRMILHLLVNEPHYVSQIAKILDLSQPAVLKQMKILKDLGLVEEVELQSQVTREKIKGPEPTYFRVSNSFLLTYTLSPYNIQENMIPLPLEGDKLYEDQLNLSLESIAAFEDKIHYINDQLAKENDELKKLEQQMIIVQQRRKTLLKKVNETIATNEVLKKDNDQQYLQRLTLRRQLCGEEGHGCVEEIFNLLNERIGLEKTAEKTTFSEKGKSLNLKFIK